MTTALSSDNLLLLRQQRPDWLREHLHAVAPTERLLVLALNARGSATVLTGAKDTDDLLDILDSGRADAVEEIEPGLDSVVLGPEGMFMDPLIVLDRDAPVTDPFKTLEYSARSGVRLSGAGVALDAAHSDIVNASFEL